MKRIPCVTSVIIGVNIQSLHHRGGGMERRAEEDGDKSGRDTIELVSTGCTQRRRRRRLDLPPAPLIHYSHYSSYHRVLNRRPLHERDASLNRFIKGPGDLTMSK